MLSPVAQGASTSDPSERQQSDMRDPRGSCCQEAGTRRVQGGNSKEEQAGARSSEVNVIVTEWLRGQARAPARSPEGQTPEGGVER